MCCRQRAAVSSINYGRRTDWTRVTPRAAEEIHDNRRLLLSVSSKLARGTRHNFPGRRWMEKFNCNFILHSLAKMSSVQSS